jgi:GH25 family lysozyme M1 (1,4-beta-N-acetylmuramidase)
MQGARAAGVYIGPYHFCRIDSKNGVPFTSYNGLPFTPGSDPYEDAVSEASDFLDAIVPYYRTGQHLPPVADVERLPVFGNVALERTFISNWVQLFSDTVQSALGVRPLIYTSRFGANTHFTPAVASQHDLWIAWWRGTGTTQPPSQSDTPLWDPWLFWQWTDSWTVPGISTLVDGDVFRGTMPELHSILLGFDGSPDDFNNDGVADAADYVAWRKMHGAMAPLYTGADANGNARIDEVDFGIWKKNFGNGADGAGAAVTPEPCSFVMLLIGIYFVAFPIRRSKGCRRRFPLR